MATAAATIAPTPIQTATQTFDRAIAGLKEGAAAATSNFEQVQAKATAQFEKAVQAARDAFAFNQGTLEAFAKSGEILLAGNQALARQAAEAARAATVEFFSGLQALAGAKTIREGIEVQTRLARTGVEAATAEATRFTKAAAQLAEQAAAPVAARVVLAAEKFATLAV